MRTRGWRVICAVEYPRCYERFGGSVITHPDVLDLLHARMPLRPRYLGLKGKNGELVGAVCRWGNRLAGDERVLRDVVQAHFDLGAPEIVLPVSSAAGKRANILTLKSSHVSALNRDLFTNLRPVRRDRRQLALAKDMSENGFSAKTKRKRRQAVRSFLEANGSVTQVQDHDACTLAAIHDTLHRSRWGKSPGERQALVDLLTQLRHLLFGQVLWLHGEPVAYDFVLMARSPGWLSAECINGGVDARYPELSVGPVLVWLNLVQAWEMADAEGRDLRFSLGRMDMDYKSTWCRPSPIDKTMTL